MLDCCARQAEQDVAAMCDATRQALIALLIEQALKAGRSDCGCEDRIQVNLAPSELPDAAPELVVTIFEASPSATADELERLVQMYNDGLLTKAEFEAAKQKALFGSAQDAPEGQEGNGDAAGQPLTDGLSANALTQQMLNSFDELKARLSTTDVELISIAQLDVPPPPSVPPLCAMPPVPEALNMQLSERARKGSKVLKLDSQQCGLEVGMKLTIGTGDTQETVTISGFGSILLLEPLRNTHAAGTSVSFLPSSPPASPVAAVEEEVKNPGGPAEGGDSAVSGDKGDEEAFMITMIVTLVLLFILACCCCCGWYLLCVAVNRKKAADEKALQEPSKHDDVQVELAEENSERWSLIALDKLAKVSGSFKNFGPPPPDRRKLSKKPQSPGKAGSENSIKEEGSTWSGPNQA